MPKFDDVINEIGAFGRYQALLILMFIGIVLPTSYNTFLPLFVLTVPKHRCALDNYANDTYGVQSPYHQYLINATIPNEERDGETVMASCKILRPKVPVRNWNGSDLGIGPGYLPEMKAVNCDRWVYDETYFERSLIEELNIVCDQKQFRAHANMAMMLGKLASAILQGILSDTFGRRFTMLFFIVIVISSTFANAFIFNLPSLIAFRFFAGLSTTSIYMNAYVIALEFIGPKYRQRFNITAALLWISGGYVLTAVAYWIRDFQHLTLALAVPTVGLASYFFLVPESPRWLISKGRSEEARKTLESMARMNKKPFPAEMFKQMVEEEAKERERGVDSEVYEENDDVNAFKMVAQSVEDLGKRDGEEKLGSSSKVTQQEGQERQKDKKEENHLERPDHAVKGKENFFTMIRHKRMVVRLAIVLLNWCANSMTYYGIIFNTQNLSGSIYINFSLTSAVDIAGNLASYYFVDKFGRKKSYNSFYIFASLALLAAIFPPLYGTKEESDTAILALTMVGRAGVSTTFNIMYLYVAELFPTTVRNSVLGVSSMASRVGSTSAPYIADLGLLLGGQMQSALPLAVFGGAGLVAAFAAFFLPETVGRILPNNIQEALDIERTSSNSSNKYHVTFSGPEDESSKFKNGVKVKSTKELPV